jgi:phospholipase D1/2
MIVDDRLAIIGSANLNERSQRGDRDSELACVIRDTDMVDSVMAGKPYKVGRFAHTMRVRLMREHLGVDVDALESEEMDMDLLNRQTSKPQEPEQSQEVWDPESEQEHGQDGVTRVTPFYKPAVRATASLGVEVKESVKGLGNDVAGVAHHLFTKSADGGYGDIPNGTDVEADVSKIAAGKGEPNGRETDSEADEENKLNGAASSVVPTIEEEAISEDRPRKERHGALPEGERKQQQAIHDPPPKTEGEGTDKPAAEAEPADDLSKTRDEPNSPPPSHDVQDTRKLAHIDTDISSSVPADIVNAHAPGERPRRPTSASQHPVEQVQSAEAAANNNPATAKMKQSLNGKPNPYTIPTLAPEIDPKGFADPVSDSFYKDVWCAVAVRNTQIFRKVFRCATVFIGLVGRLF